MPKAVPTREPAPVDPTLEALEKAFRDRYPAEKATLDRLVRATSKQAVPDGLEESDGPPWKGGKTLAKRAKILADVYERGLTKAVSRLKKATSKAARLKLVEEFVQLGARAAIGVGPQRAGDFLNNQLRGRWAEEVVLSLQIPGITFVAFGPSGAAMPGDEDHRAVVSTFAAISLLEGKRPDILGFESSFLASLDGADRARIQTWPTRLLDENDDRLIQKAMCALEVKNSLWHYGKRRECGVRLGDERALSVTLKSEEIAALQQWQDRTGVPVLFTQVLFDEVYCMSFGRMRGAIQAGFLYATGDLQSAPDRKTKKPTHQFRLADERHRLADVVFPSESVAVLRILADGYVVPHIRFAPAAARNERPDVLRIEIGFRR